MGTGNGLGAGWMLFLERGSTRFSQLTTLLLRTRELLCVFLVMVDV